MFSSGKKYLQEFHSFLSFRGFFVHISVLKTKAEWDKSILMENVKHFWTSMYKADNIWMLKSETEASHVLKKYLIDCISVYIYTV